MSLATTCPQCRTSFKVIPDQLKLRRGQVRCGVCRHVFSGLDSLRYVQADSAASAPVAAAAIRPEAPADFDAQAPTQSDPIIDTDSVAAEASTETRDASLGPTLEGPATQAGTLADTEPGMPTEPAGEPATEPALEPATEPALEPTIEPALEPTIEPALEPATEPALEPTIEPALEPATEPALEPATEPALGPAAERDTRPFDEGATAFDTLAHDLASAPPSPSLPETGAPAAPPPGDPRAADAWSTPAPDPAAQPFPVAHARTAAQTDDDETDAVDFFSTQRSARGFSTRGTLFSALASIVLAALLAIQAAIGARDWLAARYPALRPTIAAAIGPLGLEIAAPRSLESLSIEGFELQSTTVPGLYSMNALLRNGAEHDVRWPAMELSLSDQAGAVIVRKVLMPADYLPGASVRSAAGPAPAPAAGPAAGRDAAGAWPAAIAPAVEVAVRAALEASGVEPTGYTVKLFYP